MEPNSPDQRSPWHRFTLAKLLIVVTLLGVSFGIFGVPATLLVACGLAATFVYFTLVERFGWVVAFFAVMMFIGVVGMVLHLIQVHPFYFLY
jgi:hypothetical protein